MFGPPVYSHFNQFRDVLSLTPWCCTTLAATVLNTCSDCSFLMLAGPGAFGENVCQASHPDRTGIVSIDSIADHGWINWVARRAAVPSCD